MDKESLRKPILDYIQQNFAENAFGDGTQDEVFEAVYSILEETIPQTDFSEEQIGEAIDAAVQNVYSLANASEETLTLFDTVYDA
jgi:hypothetical protein